MADVIKEYAFKISVEGSKAVIKEFKEIDKKIKDGTETIDKQNKSLSKTNSLLWTYAKRLVSIYAIYKLFNKGISLAKNFAEQGNALKVLSTSANVSAKSLQKWGHLVKKYGGDEKSVASTMKSLNSSLYRLHELGQRGAFQDYMESFGEFPVADNAEDFLLELSDRIKGLSGVEQDVILDSLNIADEGLRQLLREGNITEKLKSAKVLFTDEQIEKAQKVKELMIDFNTELSRINIQLGEKFLPFLTNALKEMSSFLSNPKEYIKKSVKEAGEHFEKNWRGYVKLAGESTGVPFLSRELVNFLLQRDENREKNLKGIGFTDETLNRLAYMNYDLSRYGDSLSSEMLRREFERNIANMSVYNDNVININGTKTPEQVAQAVAGNIVGISDKSLALAGLGFATKVK